MAWSAVVWCVVLIRPAQLTPLHDSYFQLSRHDGLAVGGGQTGGALWMDDLLLHGTTNACETFRSPALGPERMFDIQRVELWGFGKRGRQVNDELRAERFRLG